MWLKHGASGERFVKRFCFSLLTCMLAWVVMFYLGRAFAWKWFHDAPFVSEEFWATCLCNALGFGIVEVSEARHKPQQTMAE